MAINTLIVDDDPLVRKALGLILQANKYHVVGETDNGNDCLFSIKNNPDINLILLDLDMPKMEGLSVLRRMRKHHPQLPVIVLSMLDPKIYAQRCMRLGAKGFLSKSDATALLPVVLERFKKGQGLYPQPAPVDYTAWGDLSDCELVYLRGLARNSEEACIASALQISRRRVRLISKLLQVRLGISSIAELRCFSQRLKLG